MGNFTVPVDTISREEAVQIYTGKVTAWPDGQTIVVVILPRENYISREFIFDWLHMSPYQFYESLEINISLRKTNSVVKVTSESEVIKKVTKTPGSIGYTSQFVYTNYNNQVKKIRIQ